MGWEREQGRGWRPVEEHRMKSGMGAGKETRAVAEISNRTNMGTGTGSRRAQERRMSGKKTCKTCRRHQSFLFNTRHHLCRPRVALAGTRQLRSQGPGSIQAHRTEGVTGCEVGEETNASRVGRGIGNRNGDLNEVGCGNGKGNGKRGTRPGRVQEMRVCPRKPRRVVDIIWKTGET